MHLHGGDKSFPTNMIKHHPSCSWRSNYPGGPPPPDLQLGSADPAKDGGGGLQIMDGWFPAHSIIISPFWHRLVGKCARWCHLSYRERYFLVTLWSLLAWVAIPRAVKPISTGKRCSSCAIGRTRKPHTHPHTHTHQSTPPHTHTQKHQVCLRLHGPV